MNIDKKIIRSLAKLLKEEELSEIEIAQGESCIRVAQNITYQTSHAVENTAPRKQPATETEPSTQGGNVIKAPMVGIVYFTPEPGSSPYITEGKSVKEGDTLLIIEAMKTMNYIKSPYTGVIRKIIVKQEDPVEFDQPLLIIS